MLFGSSVLTKTLVTGQERSRTGPLMTFEIKSKTRTVFSCQHIKPDYVQNPNLPTQPA